VLLSLGGLCVLVAAVVFVAVTWSLLGLTGRTLVLLAITTVLAVGAVVLTRKALRGAAETFWLVVAGTLTVDLLGARSAGLAGLDALDWRGTGALVGVILLCLGIGVGMWARGQVIARLYGAEAVAVAGALLVTSTNGWLATDPAVGAAIAVPVLVALFVLLRREIFVAAYGMGGLALASWLVLLGLGWDRALENAGLATWWSDFRGWPLLVAALFAALVVHTPKVPGPVRSVAAGMALLGLVLLASGPRTPGAETRDIVIGSGVLVVLGVLAAVAPRAWALGAAALASIGVLGFAVVLAVIPWDALTGFEPDGSANLHRTIADHTAAASWAPGLLALAAASALVLLLRRIPSKVSVLARHCVVAVAPAVLALGALDVVLQVEPSLWIGVLAAAVATAVAAGAAWSVRGDAPAGRLGSATTGYLGAITLWAAASNDLLVAVTSAAFAVVLGVVFALRERSGSAVSAAVAGSLAALLGAWSVVAWGGQLGADRDARAVALAGFAALVGVLAAPVARRTLSRVTLESTAVVLALAAVGGVTDERTAAMVLTIVGSACCLVSVLNRDRAALGWVGAGVLGIATVLRVAVDVQAPELYTLPAAALLLGAGVWRLRTDEEANSFLVLGKGLTLALVPSLLLALDEPVSLRGALVGAAGVLALAVGVRQRLGAPFVVGALTTAILALRHLLPYADAVPRWISLGGVGLVLLLVGITWESRRRDAETAGRYLTALR
jgi:hypothetical protein